MLLKLHLTDGKPVLVNKNTITQIIPENSSDGECNSTIWFDSTNHVVVEESLDIIYVLWQLVDARGLYGSKAYS